MVVSNSVTRNFDSRTIELRLNDILIEKNFTITTPRDPLPDYKLGQWVDPQGASVTALFSTRGTFDDFAIRKAVEHLSDKLNIDEPDVIRFCSKRNLIEAFNKKYRHDYIHSLQQAVSSYCESLEASLARECGC
jgi:hypothetical protein